MRGPVGGFLHPKTSSCMNESQAASNSTPMTPVAKAEFLRYVFRLSSTLANLTLPKETSPIQSPDYKHRQASGIPSLETARWLYPCRTVTSLAIAKSVRVHQEASCLSPASGGSLPTSVRRGGGPHAGPVVAQHLDRPGDPCHSRNSDGNPDSPQTVVFLSVAYRCNSGFLKRITYTAMPYKTGIRLLGVARNPANGFPARLLARNNVALVSITENIG